MNSLESSQAPITGGARLIMLVFVGAVLGSVLLRGVGATLTESVAVGVVAGLLLAASVEVLRRR